MGVIAITTKTKIVTAVAALLVLAGAWALWPKSGSVDPGPMETGADVASLTARIDVPPEPTGAAPLDAPQRGVVAAPREETATTGTLVVHVRYADEPKAAAGLMVTVRRPGSDFRVGVPRAVTDTSGTVQFAALAPGSVSVCTNIQQASAMAEVQPGATSECTLRLDKGMQLTGIVVDTDGVPVGGALVEAGMPGRAVPDAEQVAVTAADGTFTIRGCQAVFRIGARAAAYAASKLHVVQGKPGGAEHIRIELSAVGGVVEGVVLAPDGSALRDAVVRIGNGKTDGIWTTDEGAEPLPAQVRTDAQGRFVAVGVPVGTQPIMVRAVGLAPWNGTCEVAAGRTVPVRVTLSAGVTCVGIVRSEAGAPTKAVDVTLGRVGDFVQLRTRSAEDGTFTLTGLPVGEVELSAQEKTLGKATARVHGEAGATVRGELLLSNGLTLRGRVVDQTGAPVGGLECRWEARGAGTPWAKLVRVDAEGRFMVTDCPDGRPLSVTVEGRAITPMLRNGFDPRAGAIELEVERDLTPPAQIIGRVVGPDGRPVEGVSVRASRQQTMNDSRDESTTADGRFAMTVTTGTWALRTSSKDHPTIALDDKKMGSGTTWDVGTIQLPQGGRLVVHETAAVAGKLDHLVLDARERFVCGLYTPVPPLRSELLAPGNYRLLVCGEGVAARALPFSIEAGKDCKLEVGAAPGVRQRVEFTHVGGAELPRSIAFEVRRDGKLVLSARANEEPAGPLACEIWLASGKYSVATRDREPKCTVAFTVGSVEGPPVRLELR